MKLTLVQKLCFHPRIEILCIFPALVGCQHPKGTPTASEVTTKAAGVTGALWYMTPRAEKDRQVLPVNQDKTLDPSETRIEITAKGLSDCPKIIPSDIQFELINRLGDSITFGNLSSQGNAITSARLGINETYTTRLRRQRTGKLLSEQKITFSGSAPWLIQVSVSDCSM